MQKSKLFSLIIFSTLLGASIIAISAEVMSTTNAGNENDLKVVNTNNSEVSSNESKDFEIEKAFSNRFQTTPESPVYNYPNTSTKIELNASSYKPGETARINISSNELGLNGTFKWSLTSPDGNSFFDFNNDLTRVAFNDSTFEEELNILDWQNDTLNGFPVIQIDQSLKMLKLSPWPNITLGVGTESKLLYNPDNILSEGKYELSLNYFSSNVPDRMKIYFWDGNNYKGYSLDYGGSQVNLKTFHQNNITIGAPVNGNPQIFFNITKANSTYFLDNFKLNYYEPEIQFQMSGGSQERVGAITQTFEFENVEIRNNVTVNFQANLFRTEKFAYANFTVKLPKNMLYLGNWRFTLSVQPQEFDIDNNLNPAGPRVEYHIPINVTDTILFNSNFKYVERGYNDTLDSPIFANETGFQNLYSPGDQIVEIGELMYGTTMESFEASPYKDITGYIFSNASETNLNDYTWGSINSDLQIYNKNGNTIAEGNFSLINVTNPSRTWGLNYQIPLRGIYGNISNKLIVNFPSLIDFDTVVTPNAKISAEYVFDLGKIQVKFLTDIVDDILPFDRVYYITEFLEGNFEVNTTHFNQSINDLYPNHNITTNILIPKEDLAFRVFLSKEGANDSVLDFKVSLQDEIFFFSNIIDPNLDIPSRYDLQILWKDADEFGDKDNAQMKFIDSNSPRYLLKIQGTLRMSLPLETFSVRQNSNIEISFNITIEELNVQARGLKVFGVLCYSNSTCINTKIPIQESDGKFTLFYTVKDTLPLGQYTVQLFTVNNVDLGELSLFVLPPIIEPKSQTPEYFTIIGSGLVILVLLGFIGIVFTKYR